MILFVLGMLTLGVAQAPQPPPNRSASPAQRSLLAIVAVDVQPSKPGPDALCKLHVRIQNVGTVAASDLSFQVTVNGKLLGNFLNHTFRSTLDAGKATDVPLFNFWSSEYSRPYPTDGRFIIDVRLTGARWAAPGSANAATLAEPVQPLPAPFAVTLTR
jgi:hypothetical protein